MLTVRIVIPCFTEQRWDSILRAVRSAQDQTYTAEIVVVVDHNPRLAEQLAERISRDVTVLANRFPRGASGARNTGAFAADTDLVAFLDDDAVADPDWVKHLVAAYVRSPAAVGVGGCVGWCQSRPSATNLPYHSAPAWDTADKPKLDMLTTLRRTILTAPKGELHRYNIWVSA